MSVMDHGIFFDTRLYEAKDPFTGNLNSSRRVNWAWVAFGTTDIRKPSNTKVPEP